MFCRPPSYSSFTMVVDEEMVPSCVFELRIGGEKLRMIRKLKSGKYRLYSRKKDPKTGKRRNLGTFDTREEAEQHERAVQFFKRKG